MVLSFRSLTHNYLPCSTLFGTASVIGGELTGPSWGCGLSIFVLEVCSTVLISLLMSSQLRYVRSSTDHPRIFELHAFLCRSQSPVCLYSASSYWHYLIPIRLVVVHGYNGRKNEKFYLIGSVVMSALITIPAYAAGQYGWAVLFVCFSIYLSLMHRWDRSEKDCWYTNDNRVQRLGWQV